LDEVMNMANELIKRNNESGTKRRSVLARALARAKRRQEERKPERAAQAERPAQTTAPARYQLIEHLHCSVTGEPFRLVWQRNSKNELFTIHEIVKGHQDANRQDAQDSGADAALQKFPIKEFYYTGICCPWCGSRAGLVYCGCGDKLCGGARRWHEGVEWFTHTKCGIGGPLQPNTHVTSIKGQAALPKGSTALACRTERKRKR
jgi:hypothetical protein